MALTRSFAALGAASSQPVEAIISATHPFFDVTHPDYGAQFDGTTDDTTAINNAITAAFDEGGGTVLMPGGTAMVSQIRMKSNVALVGSGKWASELKQISGTNNHGIILDSATTTERIKLYNFQFNGQKSLQTTGDGIRIDNTGFSNSGPSGMTNPHHWIEDVIVRNCKSAGINMVGIFSESRILGCFIHSCDDRGLILDSADNLLELVTVGSSGLAGFRIADANNLLVSCKAWFSGQITAASGDGFSFSSAGDRNRLIGCEAQDNKAHGINLFQCQDNVIEGFMAHRNGGTEGTDSGVSAAGIRLDACNRNRISGNSYDDGGTPTQDFCIAFANTPTDNFVTLQCGGFGSSAISGTIGDNVVIINQGASGTGSVMLNPAGSNLGFYGVAPVARPAAYTQTYATAARTHVETAANVAHAFNIVFSDTEIEAACNALGVRINELKNLVNQIIDDDQSQGLKQ